MQHCVASNACSARTQANNTNIFWPFICNLQRVSGSCRYNNCRAVLVVVEHGNIHPLTTNSFNNKTIWGLDVFKVNGSKCRLKLANQISECLWIGLINFDIKTVKARKLFEQDRLALHHWLTSLCPNIA